MHRIVLIGNCQLELLANLYRRFAADPRHQELIFLPTHEDLSDAGRRALETADVLVEQVQELTPKPEWVAIARRAEKIAVPLVTLSFLWPFGGQQHPLNPHPEYRPAGPYSAEAGDCYLNMRIASGADPEAVVEEYCRLDLATIVNLDFLYRLSQEKQRRRDAQSGFRIADIIAEHFRDEPVFLSPHHPNTRVATALAGEFAARLGASHTDIRRLGQALRVTPIARDELPIHWSVARHFGLRFIGPEPRFRFMDEGGFTFREYALRYMRCEWNEKLEEGIQLAGAGAASARVLELICAGLRRSPVSAAGYNALGMVLGRLGRFSAAVAAAQRAVELAPASAGFRAELGALLRDSGDRAGGEREFRRAVALDPSDPHFVHLLAAQLREMQRLDEARSVCETGLAMAPRDPELRVELGHILRQRGDAAAAERTYRQALDVEPGSAAASAALAALLGGPASALSPI